MRGLPLGLAKACHPQPTVAVTAVGSALAAASGRSASGVVAVGSAVLAGQLSVGWHNDWVDAERDRRSGRAGKPLVEGALPERLVGLSAAAAAILCIPLSLLSGWRAGLAHIAAVALAWGYNGWLKGTSWSWFPYAASFSLLIAFVSLGRAGHPAPPWWGLSGAALLGVGAHFANVVPDLRDDQATGVRGLPHRLGRSPSAAIAAGLMLAASAVVAFGSGWSAPTSVGLGVAVAVVATAAVVFARGHESSFFQASMAVALVDVAMLISRGSQL